MSRTEIIQLDVRAYLEIQPQFQYNKITRERVRLSCEYRNHECAESDSDTAQYDNSAKRLLGNKYILAQILVYLFGRVPRPKYFGRG